MSSSRHIVIVGGGTGGTTVANRLRRALHDTAVDITVIDQNNDHVYQPGLLFLPFGLADAPELVRPRTRQLHDGIAFIEAAVDRVDVERSTVHLEGGRTCPYDVLIVASGAVLLPEETEGLLDGWYRNALTFYSLEGAQALRNRLMSFREGRIAVAVMDMPIKCPVAPLEFAFLSDWYFHERGVRDGIDITYVTPLDGAFTKPVASHQLQALLENKGIGLVTEFNTGTVDAAAAKLVSYDGREVDFDLAVVVPLHGGAPFVGRSEGLGDALNFIPADPHTMQAQAAPNVFVIGDAAGLPASKAGSVAHFEADAVTENVVRFLAGTSLTASYDGHANCFIETGFNKAVLIDFNYETEPLPGHFPGRVGLPLLKESRLNHIGKLMFEWMYWHALLPGHPIPGVTAEMRTAGKHRVAARAG